MANPIPAGKIIATSMSPTPSPRLWPVATVMATGIFATTFVQFQALGTLPFNHLLKQMGLDSNQAQGFISLATLPWSFKYIAGLFMDGVPLFGSRRRSYLLLSALAAAVFWLCMGFSANNYHSLLFLAVAMNCMIVIGSTASGGLLVESGQNFGATGRLSSLRVFAQNLGASLGLPVGGLLAAQALGWTSVAAMIPLLCMFLAAWFLLKDSPLPVEAIPAKRFSEDPLAIFFSMGRQIRNVWLKQMVLPAVLIFFVQAVPTFRSACLYQYQTGPLHYTDAAVGWIGFVGYGVALLSSGVYAWSCRRIPLRISLYIAIFLISLSALPYLFYAAYTPYMLRTFTIEGVGTFLLYLAYLPLFDLVVRTAPIASSALGYSVLIGAWNLGLVTGTQLGPALYEHWFHKNMNSLIWLNAGITLAGLYLVFLLPKALVGQSEGKAIQN